MNIFDEAMFDSKSAIIHSLGGSMAGSGYMTAAGGLITPESDELFFLRDVILQKINEGDDTTFFTIELSIDGQTYGDRTVPIAHKKVLRINSLILNSFTFYTLLGADVAATCGVPGASRLGYLVTFSSLMRNASAGMLKKAGLLIQ